jgi:hypothetical protein
LSCFFNKMVYNNFRGVLVFGRFATPSEASGKSRGIPRGSLAEFTPHRAELWCWGAVLRKSLKYRVFPWWAISSVVERRPEENFTIQFVARVGD